LCKDGATWANAQGTDPSSPGSMGALERLDEDLNLCRNATEYTNNHEYKDAVEITLHFININELKFVYK
jgi:hypothetical protein